MTSPRTASSGSGILTVGAAVFAIGISTTLPMPLFTEYAARDGQGAGGLAAAFVAYAFTLIISAPLLGGLSDRIGRKPCVLAGLVLAGLSTFALAIAPGLVALAIARVLQGLAVGLIAGAATAWAAELAGGPQAGARAAATIAVGTAGSYGTGGVLTLLALALFAPTEPPLTFWLHWVVIAALLPLVALLPETRAPMRVAWLRNPRFPRGTLATTFGIFPAWGMTGSIITSVPATLAAQGLPRAGPIAICFMILFGTAVQQGLRGMAPRRAVLIGLGVLVLGAALAILGTLAASLPVLALGAAAVGSAAYGLLFVGGLAAASESAAERARAGAGFFLVAHIGFFLPPLLTGLAVDRFGAGPALIGLWLFVAVFCAALALVVGRAGINARSE